MDSHFPLMSSRRLKNGRYSASSDSVSEQSPTILGVADLTHDTPHKCRRRRDASSVLQNIMNRRFHRRRHFAIIILQEDVSMVVPIDLVCRMFGWQRVELSDHPFQGNITQLERVVRLDFSAVTWRHPAPANVTVVSGEKNFLDIFFCVLLICGSLVLLEEGGFEFAATLVY